MGVCSGAGSYQKGLPAVDLIDEQPIREYMALPKACVIAHKRVVAILLFKRFFLQKCFQGFFKQIHFIAALLHQLVVLAE